MPPSVEISLTDLPKSEGAMAPPAPPGTTGLQFIVGQCAHFIPYPELSHNTFKHQDPLFGEGYFSQIRYLFSQFHLLVSKAIARMPYCQGKLRSKLPWEYDITIKGIKLQYKNNIIYTIGQLHFFMVVFSSFVMDVGWVSRLS